MIKNAYMEILMILAFLSAWRKVEFMINAKIFCKKDAIGYMYRYLYCTPTFLSLYTLIETMTPHDVENN